MLQFQTWKIFAVLGVVLLGFLTALPNFIPQTWRDAIQRNAPFIPHRPVTLGLDLQGGSYVLFEAQIDVAVKDKLQGLLDDIRGGFRKAKILYNSLSVNQTGLSVRVADPAKIEAARTFLRGLASPTGTSVVGITSNDFDVRIDETGLATMTMTNSGREQIRTNAMAQSVEILRKRIDPDGTKEVTIQPQGANRIIVQVPGEQNPQEIIRRGSTAAKLTFHMVDESVSMADIEAKRIPPGSKLMTERRGKGPGAQDYPLVIKERAIISGDMLEKAQGTIDAQSQLPIISFKFNAQGSRRFADVTKNNVGKRFAAVLDSKVITAPVIRSPILGGQGIIEGDFSIEEANETAVLLNSGALFVPLKAEDQRTVGAELGQDSIERGQYAALGGLLLVVAFMILQYRLFGVFADVALLANIVMLLGFMTTMGATLTLPGIAAFVLTMGMAVDANVLIYERIREEQRNGKTLMAAVDAGFERAMATVTDANVTHVLAGLILLMVGTGPVRGFAVVFVVGVATSFFTAIFVTRLQVIAWLRAKRRHELPI